MPFTTKTVMEQRLEFVLLAAQPKANLSDLCRRHRITRKTAYKWIRRYHENGVNGLSDQSRKPKQSPGQTKAEIEQRILSIRDVNPEWGAKKIYRLLNNQQNAHSDAPFSVPGRSTIAAVLKRQGRINPERSEKATAWKRFEYEQPNELWQMDFKGHFALDNERRCYPLTILDDHSRFNLGLVACKDERRETVEQELIRIFRVYGLPEKILADNGNPWGAHGMETGDGTRPFTELEKWLIRLGIKIVHGRAYHPQTQGKEERFHRTLKAELLQYERFRDYGHCQTRFDWWRTKYNCERPHEALDFEVPAKRYCSSKRSYPEVMPPIEYGASDMVRKVQDRGKVSFNGKDYRVGRAFTGDYVAVRRTRVETEYDVYFCNQLIKKISL